MRHVDFVVYQYSEIDSKVGICKWTLNIDRKFYFFGNRKVEMGKQQTKVPIANAKVMNDTSYMNDFLRAIEKCFKNKTHTNQKNA